MKNIVDVLARAIDFRGKPRGALLPLYQLLADELSDMHNYQFFIITYELVMSFILMSAPSNNFYHRVEKLLR